MDPSNESKRLRGWQKVPVDVTKVDIARFLHPHEDLSLLLIIAVAKKNYFAVSFDKGMNFYKQVKVFILSSSVVRKHGATVLPHKIGCDHYTPFDYIMIM